jgi:hypothetical protein
MKNQMKRAQFSPPNEEAAISSKCSRCGQPLVQEKVSALEGRVRVLSLLVFLSVFAVLSYVTIDRILPALQHPACQPVWREPLDDWNLD